MSKKTKILSSKSYIRAENYFAHKVELKKVIQGVKSTKLYICL